jgi:hypothetical protein
MNDINIKSSTKVQAKTERPRLHKVILVNDDYTPREFVVRVLKAEFHMSEDHSASARRVRRRRLHEGRGGSQGDECDGRRPQQRLSAVVHDRAGGIATAGGRTLPDPRLRGHGRGSPRMKYRVPAVVGGAVSVLSA